MSASRVCSSCRREKPETVEHFHPNGKRADGSQRWKARCIPCYRRYQRETMARERPEERAQRLARDAERQRRRARTPEGREAMREARARAYARVAEDEKRLAARREAARIRHRLRAEREGREVAASVVQAPVTRGERIPSRPLVVMLDRLADRARRHDLVLDVTESIGHRVREQLGLSDRVEYALRAGARWTVDLALADQLVTRADLLWFDVFDEDTLRLGLEVRRYVMREKRLPSGARRMYRERVGTVLVGDWGPDLRALRLVEALFTGEGLAEVHEQLQLGEVEELWPVALRAAA